MKLHLGCGKRDFGSEWIHIDGGDFPHLHSHDITKLPFDDNTVDIIYSAGVFEYFDKEESIDVLKEWRRVLKHDGILRLAVPDFRKIVKLYLEKDYSLSKFLGSLYGKIKMGNETIYHKIVYDYSSLSYLLETNGFIKTRLWDWRKVDHGHIDDHSQTYLPHMDKENGELTSLNIECNKI